MPALNLDVLPERPAKQVKLAIFREGLVGADTQLTNEEIIEVACTATAPKAPFLEI